MPTLAHRPPDDLSRWSGQFVHPEREAAFREWSGEDHATRATTDLRVAAVLMGAFCFLDVGFLGPGPKTVALCAARLSWSGASLIVAARAGQFPTAFLDRCLSWLGVTAAAIVLAAVAVRRPGFQPHTFSTAAVVVALYLLMPLRFHAALGATTLLTAGYLVVTAVGGIAPVPLLAIAASLAIASATGVAGHGWVARVARMDFLRIRGAEQAHAERLAFLAATSHELRTPLHGIVACAELLSGTTLSAEQRELVGLIRSSGAGMASLLEEAVRQVRGGSDRPVLAPRVVDLHLLLEDLRAFLEARAAAHGVSVSSRLGADVPRFAHADAGRIRQIILNFAENALVHGAKARIEVSLDAAPVDDDDRVEVVFGVSDDGPGVSAEMRESILRPFVQAGEIDVRSRGMGLGLAICVRLAKAMDGEIAIEDASIGGARFVFRAPLRIAHAAPVDETLGSTPSERLDLLLVEDEAVGRRLVTRLLERDGHRVTLATSGESAIDLARARRFDAVIMDVRLPRMDGMEATRRILALEDPPSGVIAMSAHIALASEGELASVGFHSILDKPIDLTQLRAALASVMTPSSKPPASTASGAQPEGAIDVPTPSEPNAQWLDEARLGRHITALGEDEVRHLLELFLETTPLLINDLDRAVQESRGNDIAAIAHRLGGAADSVALVRCSEVAAVVEGLARREQGVPEDAIQRLRRAHAASCAAAQSCVQDLSGKAG